LPSNSRRPAGQRAALEHGVGVEPDDHDRGVVLAQTAVGGTAWGGDPVIIRPRTDGAGEEPETVLSQLQRGRLGDGSVHGQGQDDLAVPNEDGGVADEELLLNERDSLVDSLLWDCWRRGLGCREPRDGDGNDETGDDVMPQRPLASWSMDSLGHGYPSV